MEPLTPLREDPIRVLFVCTGNLCRSPMAHGILQAYAYTAGLDQGLIVDSAGVNARPGLPPEPHAIEAALAYGADISQLRSRAVTPGDFVSFDRLIAMDYGHLDALHFSCPAVLRPKLTLLFPKRDNARAMEVPDPYQQGLRQFERSARLIADGVRAVLEEILAWREGRVA